MSAVMPETATARSALVGLSDASTDEDVRATFARAVWSTLVEPGDGVAGALVQAVGPEDALEVAFSTGPAPDAAQLTRDQLAGGRARWAPRRGGAAAALDRARHCDVRLLTPSDPDWPERASDLGPHGPICLWTRGDTRLLRDTAPAIALVGARASTSYGEFVAAEFAAESAAAEVAVVSGGAYGIDGAAHRSALSAGGATVAIMAGGLDKAYPAGHRDLIDAIARKGLVLAEVPCGTTPTKHRFLSRNRLIAALSDATVVVEAGWRSGAQNTAHHAQAMGRPVGAVPGPVTSAASMGCHRLLRDSDATCVTCFADVRELIEGVTNGPATLGDESYTDDRTRILDALSVRAPRTVMDIARRAGFGLEEASSLLGILELDGAVRRSGEGWVQAGAGLLPTLW